MPLRSCLKRPLPSLARPRLLALCAGLALGACPALLAADSTPPPPPESPAAVPRLALLSINSALEKARAHLASLPGESDREIVGIQFIPPHGRPGPGFWLIDLAPYPADRPSPARTVSSLLLAMDGKIEERGGRRALNASETSDRDKAAATLHQRMRQASGTTPTPPPPASQAGPSAD